MGNLEPRSSEISARIRQIRVEKCHGNNEKFAELLGKSKQYVSSLCNGKESTGNKIIDDIISVFPDISRDWLYSGKGSMFVTEPIIEAHPHSTVNTISHTGRNSTNSINAGSLNDMLMQMYEARLADKDDVISTLKDTIKALQGEVEQLRSYVKLTSTKYIEEIERMRQTTIDTHDIVKDCANHIGYSKK